MLGFPITVFTVIGKPVIGFTVVFMVPYTQAIIHNTVPVCLVTFNKFHQWLIQCCDGRNEDVKYCYGHMDIYDS